MCAVVLATGAALGVKYGRYHVFPKRFAVVEPGELYRSGELEAWPLERVIREHHLKTILTLLHDEPDDDEQRDERAICARTGVRRLRIAMPGNGCADFDLLDQAAAVIADEANRPLLVHCAAGVNRTGAAYAAWRMKYRGWSFEDALAEAEERGYRPGLNPELREHLQRYFDERVGPISHTGETPVPQRRPRGAGATGPSPAGPSARGAPPDPRRSAPPIESPR